VTYAGTYNATGHKHARYDVPSAKFVAVDRWQSNREIERFWRRHSFRLIQFQAMCTSFRRHLAWDRKVVFKAVSLTPQKLPASRHSLVGDERKRGPDQVDLAHSLRFDRFRGCEDMVANYGTAL
jgi:hypothetical protein